MNIEKSVCLKEKQLVKKSHIIPDFLYSDIYDSNHKILKFRPYEYVHGVKLVMKVSTGEYDTDVLCKECENHISKYESYAKNYLFTGYFKNQIKPKVTHYVNTQGIEFFLVENTDYLKFKIFLLSILWRANISKREVFKEIQINEDSEYIRKMILDNNPGDITQYPILFWTYLTDKKIPHQIIGQPTIVKVREHYVAKFIIRGFWFMFVLNNKVTDNFILDNTIQYSGEYKIFVVPQGKAGEYLKHYLGL